MRYVEFRDEIRGALRASPHGITWAELRDRLKLPYDRPCPAWVEQMEREIGLSRSPGPSRAFVWTMRATAKKRLSRR